VGTIIGIFLVFAYQGAWPVPDVNESHYVAKMIAFWNPDWVPNDPFLQSADAHPVFFALFGWPSRFLSAEVFTWAGRAVCWALLALGWFALARQLLDSLGKILLSAILFGCVQERFNMAGEWVIGGLEAKVPAYALVFFALAALVRRRWNLTWILLGGASALHVLVGGWAALAAAITWVGSDGRVENLRKMLPGLILGGLLALPGLIPALRLSFGVDWSTQLLAGEVYLYRLGHHLSLLRLGTGALDRFLLLFFLWFILGLTTTDGSNQSSLGLYVGISLGLATLGGIWSIIEWLDPRLAAAILRYYWFRLADVMLPLAVALTVTRVLFSSFPAENPDLRAGRWLLLGVLVLHLVSYGYERVRSPLPRADENRLEDYAAWRDVCQWIAGNEQIPPDARFLTPRMAQTFRWYARRPEVVNWKDIPQDARSIVWWWQALCEVHAYRDPAGQLRWLPNLAQAGTDHIRNVAQKYGARYALTPAWPPLDLPKLYENGVYAVYEIPQ
jgi:hypothetical protein